MSQNFVKFGKVQVKSLSFHIGALLWKEPIFEKFGKMSTKSLDPVWMSRFPVSSLKGSEWPKPQCRGAQLMLRSSRKGQKQITWSGPQSWLVCLRQTCWTLWGEGWGPEISARPATGSAIPVAMSQNNHNIYIYYFSYHLVPRKICWILRLLGFLT